MLEFKPVSVKDKLNIDSFFAATQEISCEVNFATLLIWQTVYGTRFAICGDCMIVRMLDERGFVYSLPFGNFERGMELIFNEEPSPRFWVQEGERYDRFIASYGARYIINEERNAFDYLYLRTDLAELSGRKYQAKRNHISAFSRAHDWRFVPICADNTDDVKACAEQWYAENHADGKYLDAERNGVYLLLDNMERLGAKGGAITVDGKVVAFTVGTAISNEIFDIHIEKALADYSTAYAVINREFARSLSGYTYINREDDMGLDGLRKAKLSYRPVRLIRKFGCDCITAVREKCFELYRETFGNSGEFDRKLFDLFFDCCKYIVVDGEVVSMLFALPCTLCLDGERYPCRYIYAAATAEKFRSQGYMSRLICEQTGTLLLKPASESLIGYYKKHGFVPFNAYHAKSGERRVETDSRFSALAADGNLSGTPFTAMIKSEQNLDCEGLSFAYTME